MESINLGNLTTTTDELTSSASHVKGTINIGGNVTAGTGGEINVNEATGATAIGAVSLGYCGTSGGTANAQTLTPAPAVTALVAGMVFTFLAVASNTGAATLNVSGLGATAIKKQGTTALASGDILIGGAYMVVYDGTNFQLLNPFVA